ncbi:CRAL-TRIO domain-containing protein [Pleurotus pulmonarius]|nr:hypothetical protein EYR38_006344 [Pleurotus pulmonarius]
MEIHALLQANCEKLLEQYRINLRSVRTLQATLIDDILPSIRDELDLSQEATSWARVWLEDTFTVFQIARRHKFTRSFAMESIRKILVWRLDVMWPVVDLGSLPAVFCFPNHIRDPFGRPILLIKSSSLSMLSDSSKAPITQGLELLRQHLRLLNSSQTEDDPPILQYVVLLDLAGLSMQGINIDLITWTLRETIPRFPGMLAAVFMVNYSWAHSGIWTVVKRLLPSAALSRVFFPTRKELLDFFTPACLPADYGGSLPCLTRLEDPLQAHQIGVSTQLLPSGQPLEPPELPSSPPLAPTTTFISRTSILNPFFGYPVDTSRGSTQLRHGRRRKRDLIRTLAFLLWVRWRSYLKLTTLLLLLAGAIRLLTRKGLHQSLRRIFLKALPWS